ncbi:hypothetical protein [Polaribacter sp. L3A8]|uniref:hypothetical protein n=1 Tax=Polaribacter sp. L3A8 TaxID=2686361 RepID=UPI00131B5EF9|nr:hypothetical protein [Polaribacter sp. L3A8]
MFLQVFAHNVFTSAKAVFENQLVFVILGLVILVFLILRIAKSLSKMSFNKANNKSGYNS